ncbi:MAG: serine/threonine-protein kinase [Polyangiaceae bacterium]|jgi:serine/threonine-protein kinase
MSESETDADEQVARARARLGTTLRGKYRLDRILGVGGMAAVYAATHRNGNEFAVKLLHPELSLSSDLRNRFLREGQAAGAVKHPGVVSVLDDDVAEDGTAFLVMELLRGESVEAVWERLGKRLADRFVVDLGIELLDVLAAAHERGVVHRDIKPANLLLTLDGRLKVLDFGIARLRDAASSQATRTGITMGTPAFMAPEQVLGKTGEIDGRTDVWAAGATLFTLASGRLVHEADTVQQMMISAATTPAPSLASVLPGAHPSLCAVVDGALAFARADRFAGAASMRDALRKVSASLYGGGLPQRSLLELSETARKSAESTQHSTPAHPSSPAPAPSALDRAHAAPVLDSAPLHAPSPGPSPAASGWMPPGPRAIAQPLAVRHGGAGSEFVTAQPVSRDSPSKSLARANSRLVVVLASLVGALVVMATAAVAIIGSRSSTSAPAVPVMASAPTATASSQNSVEVNVINYPSPTSRIVNAPAAAPASAGSGPSKPQAPTSTAEVLAGSAGAVTPSPASPPPRAMAPPAAPAVPAKPSGSSKPACYYYENGIKKWRRECLSQ